MKMPLYKAAFAVLSCLFLWSPTVFSGPEEYDELTFVFRSFPAEAEADRLECKDIEAPFWDVANVDLLDIYSIYSLKNSGLVLEERIQKVGSILTCTDWTAFDVTQPDLPIPAYFRISINDMELIAIGDGRYFNTNTPELGVAIGNWTLEIQPQPPEILGGLLASNTLSNLFGPEEYADTNGSFATVRLYTPKDEQQKALERLMRGLLAKKL